MEANAGEILGRFCPLVVALHPAPTKGLAQAIIGLAHISIVGYYNSSPEQKGHGQGGGDAVRPSAQPVEEAEGLGRSEDPFDNDPLLTKKERLSLVAMAVGRNYASELRLASTRQSSWKQPRSRRRGLRRILRDGQTTREPSSSSALSGWAKLFEVYSKGRVDNERAFFQQCVELARRAHGKHKRRLDTLRQVWWRRRGTSQQRGETKGRRLRLWRCEKHRDRLKLSGELDSRQLRSVLCQLLPGMRLGSSACGSSGDIDPRSQGQGGGNGGPTRLACDRRNGVGSAEWRAYVASFSRCARAWGSLNRDLESDPNQEGERVGFGGSQSTSVAVIYFRDQFTVLKGIGLVIIMLGVSLFNWYKYEKLQKGHLKGKDEVMSSTATNGAAKYAILDDMDDQEDAATAR
ncbi:hypothetical protein ACLOJK_010665 [Asimina triloba]